MSRRVAKYPGLCLALSLCAKSDFHRTPSTMVPDQTLSARLGNGSICLAAAVSHQRPHLVDVLIQVAEENGRPSQLHGNPSMY